MGAGGSNVVERQKNSESGDNCNDTNICITGFPKWEGRRRKRNIGRNYNNGVLFQI